MELHLNNRSVNPINIADTPTEGPFIATLSTILPSLTGFQGWLTLFLICCAFEMCRRATFQAWDSILASFWTTIDLEGDSRSYGEYLLAAPASVAAAVSPSPDLDHTLHL